LAAEKMGAGSDPCSEYLLLGLLQRAKTCFSLIFAEDPAVMIILPASGKVAAMCQHTVNFKDGIECPPSC